MRVACKSGSLAELSCHLLVFDRMGEGGDICIFPHLVIWGSSSYWFSPSLAEIFSEWQCWTVEEIVAFLWPEFPVGSSWALYPSVSLSPVRSRATPFFAVPRLWRAFW